ncbi:uncharacterized protein LOC127258499 [Andrographis paniculata]|uniref:uncharacterized protein LOC127258499 n=1 Tax=Andrographis paniculata TaxID=175694 RepID=UPI0021E91416|nr:uncharacterized protein LOC127258499 [Andrographis paniculata]
MTPFEGLYGRKCRTPLSWDDISDRLILGPEMIKESKNKIRVIREKMKIAQDCQKSNADKARSEGQFQSGDFILVKESPMMSIRRFGIKGKLSPLYVGPYVVDPSHILSPDELELNEDLSYEEMPIWIMDTKVRTMRNRNIWDIDSWDPFN